MTSNKTPPVVDLHRVLAAAQLAALPQSAVRLLELSRNPANGASEFAAVIEADPALAVQVLRFANSSYFGFSRDISSVKLAIALVGVRTVKNFALWNAVFCLVPNPQCGPFDLRSLWQDSLRRALFARALAQELTPDKAEDVFTAALLQDIAVPVLAKAVPQLYVRLLVARGQGHRRISEMEKNLFGWNHAEAGGILVRQWSFSEEFAVMVEGHTELDRWLEQPQGREGELTVAMSALLPSTVDPTWVERDALEQSLARLGAGLGLPELLQRIDHEFADFAPLLKIATPSTSLVECYHEPAVVG